MADDILNLLKQYRALTIEIDLLNKKLNETVFDKVYGSDSEYPFTEKSFQLEGVSGKQYGNYSRMLKRAVGMHKKVIDWIEKIPDSTTRLVFIYRYDDKLSWNEIGSKLNYSPTHVKENIHDKYLKDCE